MLYKIFENIKKQEGQYATSGNGEEFEDKLIKLCRELQWTPILSPKAAKLQGDDHIIEIAKLVYSSSENKFKQKIRLEWTSMKKRILDKNSLELCPNHFGKELDRYFIYQPFGSQDYPDFIFFTSKFIIPVEVKYSKPKSNGKKADLDSTRPMWNSNLPKGNGLYLFGVAAQKVTFFKGSDVLDSDTRIQLNNYFAELGGDDENIERDIEALLKDLPNPFGFSPYIRKAFEHKKKYATSISEDGHQHVESFFSKNSREREDNVIEFLKSIESE